VNYYFKIYLFLIVVCFFSGHCEASQLNDYCKNQFFDNGSCPDNICSLTCAEFSEEGKCLAKECYGKVCFEISLKNCPKEFCDILIGCSGEKVCYSLPAYESDDCGKLAYTGGNKCCEGFIKKCGVEYLDKTCEMSPINSSYSVAMCLPCGNGVCNQFENRCNCPEDCGKSNVPIKSSK